MNFSEFVEIIGISNGREEPEYTELYIDAETSAQMHYVFVPSAGEFFAHRTQKTDDGDFKIFVSAQNLPGSVPLKSGMRVFILRESDKKSVERIFGIDF